MATSTIKPVPTLYERLQQMGVECFNWESDLYFPVTDETSELVDALKETSPVRVRTFKSEADGRMMFEAPFMFDPYWKARAASQKE